MITNLQTILNDALLNKTLVFYVEDYFDNHYGDLKFHHPVASDRILTFEGKIVEVQISMEEYETGSIQLKAEVKGDDIPFTINASYHDFELK
jgi:hypothetical protein